MRQLTVRLLLALAVAAMGVVDVISAVLSHPPDRIMALRHLLPTGVLDTSRTFTLLAGTLLLLTANGLHRGKRRAFVTALFLCAVSVPVNLLKAGDVEEATLAAALLFVMGTCAQAFTVKSREWEWRSFPAPVAWGVVGILAYALVGCWWVELAFGHQASLARAAQEALHQLFGIGAPALIVSRAHHVVRWYLGSISVLGLTLLIGFVLALLQPARHLRRHQADAQRVRDLVRAHGDSSVSWFALDDDTDWFFSANGRAVLAYRHVSGVLLVVGDPIGPEEELGPLLESFQRFCQDHDWTFAFYQARPEHLTHYRARGWHAVHIGEDPVLWTAAFSLEGAAIGEVRRAVHKAERAGLEVRHFIPGVTPFSAAPDHGRLATTLRDLSAEWLQGRAGGEKGFCMGRFDTARLDDVWLAVAWRPATTEVEAFCTWTPVWARRGWALDLMRRHTVTTPGAMELLVVRSLEQARDQGDALLSLSLSALVQVDDPTDPPRSEAATDPARAFLIERLSRFYDFRGLFRWKRKFVPSFEDRYLVFADALALPRIALALVRAQTPGGLWSFVRRNEPHTPDCPRAEPPTQHQVA